MPDWLRVRVPFVALALGTIALGLAVHRGGDALGPATRDVLGDALWAMMIVWWSGVVAPRAALWKRGVAALAVCFAVELSQRYQTPALNAIRRTSAGHLVLGSDFDPRDLVAYTAGVVVAVFLAGRRARGGRVRSASLALIAGVTMPVAASDQAGVYGVVDRVVFEPDSARPAAIQVWGVFAIAQPVAGAVANSYQPARRGYLYFAAPSDARAAIVAEWMDLKRVAGTGQPVAFGARNASLPRVRPASDRPVVPDAYPLGLGVIRLPADAVGPTRDVRLVPAPLLPAEGAFVPAGTTVRLVARNVFDGTLPYVFEIGAAGLERPIRSDPIRRGSGGETSWTPPAFVIKPGLLYRWRVWVIDGETKRQAAEASFRGQ